MELPEVMEVEMDNGRRITVIPDNLSSCRSCGETVIWCVTKNGKKMPVDPPLDEEEGVGTSHFATCQDAAQWRKT